MATDDTTDAVDRAWTLASYLAIALAVVALGIASASMTGSTALLATVSICLAWVMHIAAPEARTDA